MQPDQAPDTNNNSSGPTTSSDAPDYLTPLDVYATSTLKGLLAAGHPYSTDQALAKEVFRIADVLMKERENYFMGTPDVVNPALVYHQVRDMLRNLDYSQLSVEQIQKLHARHDDGCAFNTAAEACAAIPLTQRYPGLQVQVGAPGCYSWWPTQELGDADLVPVIQAEV